MKKLPIAFGVIGVGALLLLAGMASSMAAPPPAGGKIRIEDLLGPKKALPLFSASGATNPTGNQPPILRVALTPSTAKKGDVVTLSVTVSLPAGSYTYSTNTSVLGATRIDITDASGLKPIGVFEADHTPKLSSDEETGKPVEKFEDGATWLRQYILTADKPEDVGVRGMIDLKYCDSLCRPFKQEFSARLVKGTSADDGSSDNSFRQVVTPTSIGGRSGHAKLQFQLSPTNPKPGDMVTLAITMSLDAGWHTYSTTQKEAPGATITTIKLDSAKGLRPIGDAFQADHQPEHSKPIEGEAPNEIHFDSVTWNRRFTFEPAAGQNGFGISGNIHYGVCDEHQCLPPKTVPFVLGDVKGAGPLPMALADDTPSQTASAVIVATSGELWFYIATAFLGGILLNVMPCVLPVLAIKVLSFVRQAGESRSRVFLLNVAYTFGVLAIFLTLATLAVVFQVAWGGLFQKTWFNLTMACLVFAMGLSLLGMFEIPVPGMIGSAAGSQQREGVLGAFLTGIFATLLATPCLGPFMGVALGWSILQPAYVTYLIWGVVGLGMASPYLVIAVTPQFVKWLPKPGTWMVRFKELAGFVLLGSVIFIIYYTDKKFTISALVMLLGVAVGLWMIGNWYDFNSRFGHKMKVRVAAISLTSLICWFGYSLSVENKYQLPWQPFSDARIATLLKDNKTVLVDFTADWCANCHFNEHYALDTRDTQYLVEKHGVVTLKADFTNESPEILRWLMKFQQNGVPLTVIFPAGQGKKPIVLLGVYTQGTLLDKLKEAVQPEPADASAEVTAAERR